MCAESYNQSAEKEEFINILNIVFITIFTLECLMKLAALSWRFFKIPWNVFDIVIVVLSLLGFIYSILFKIKIEFS